MKTKNLLLISALCMAVSLQAQAPQKFNYQGIARTGAGAPMANQTLGLEISILNGTTAQYVERHTATTNAIGLYTVQIGGGTAVTGTMAAVTWSVGNKNIKVGIDPNGGTNYTNMGTTELLSVPYALYAAQGNPGPQGPQGVAGPAGATGNTGAVGPQGSQGAAGPIGPTGPAGGPGATGATGPAGTPGAAGATGATGPVGPIGPIGPQGIPGTPAAAGWALNGNAATATDFIGTTNDQPLRFKMNGENAGMIGNTGSGRTSLGLNSLNNSTGVYNTAVGSRAMQMNTTGEYNTALGGQSLPVNTTGGYNTAVGMESLRSNTTGERNTAVGYVALSANTTGARNTAIGQLSLYSNSIGHLNTAVGWGSVSSNTTGSNNVGVGYKADVGSGALTNATAIGATAQVDQSNSLVLGSISGVNTATASTKVGIGTTAPNAPLEIKSTSSATVPQLRLTNNTTGPSRIHFQNTNTGAWTLDGARASTTANSLFNVVYSENANGSGGDNILSVSGQGKVGINTSPAGTTISDGALSVKSLANVDNLSLLNTAATKKWGVYVSTGLELYYQGEYRGTFNSTSGAYASTSDRRLKENIIPAKNILDQIKGIEVMRYTFKADESHQPQLGYIAQNLEEHFPEFVNKPDTESGRESFYTVNYAGMSAVAIRAIQEQQEVIEGQQARIKEQQEMNQGQQAMIEALQQAVANMQARMDELGK